MRNWWHAFWEWLLGPEEVCAQPDCEFRPRYRDAQGALWCERHIEPHRRRPACPNDSDAASDGHLPGASSLSMTSIRPAARTASA